MKAWIHRIVWTLVAIGAVVALVLALRPPPIPVDVGEVRRGPLTVEVTDDGVTRVRERFTISAPIQGRLIRTPLEAGDQVVMGKTVVAEFAPITASPLDARSREEAAARLRRAVAADEEARARADLARTDVDYFTSEHRRIRKLVEDGVEREELLDRARRDETRARQELRAADFLNDVAQFGVELARAGLVEDAPEPPEAPGVEPPPRPVAVSLRLQAPVGGQVLRVHEESSRTVQPGTPILELGDVRTLEVIADFLSQDAVRVQPGMRVRLDGWGGEGDRAPVLRGRVRRVEPSGFTKVSALGVEEQRVNVRIDPEGDEDAWARMGDGFRVMAHVELWAGDDVLAVPTGALFRLEDGRWAVFVVDDDRVRQRPVRLGRRSGLWAQVLEGLEEGEPVVLYPSEIVRDGSKVTTRT